MTSIIVNMAKKHNGIFAMFHKYLKFNVGSSTEAGSVTIANGKMSTLGTTVDWYIRRVGNNEYV